LVGMEKFELALEEYRKEIEKGIVGVLSRAPKNLRDSVGHIIVGGKRLRPIMVLASCEAAGGEIKKAVGGGVGIELIHTFSLVHDDIMDRSEERRGRKCVHVEFGTSTAILAGDLLEAIGLELMGRDGLSEKGTELTKRICEGQKMDIDFESKEIKDEEYFRMIELKTAYTFKCAAEVGAILGGGEESVVEKLGVYGMNFGMAFQIGDDIADTFSSGSSDDLEAGKKTMPVVSGWSFEDALTKGDDLMKRYSERALDSISELEESRGKDVLVALAQRYGRVGGFI